jgi:hypothetical protein
MDIKEITKLFDLEYFDGPLLSLFADIKGNLYLYKWYDLQENAHQWLVFPIDYKTLSNYLNNMIPEAGLLQSSGSFYIVKFNEKGRPLVVGQKSKQEVVREYAKTSEVYFDEALCPHWKAVQPFFRSEPFQSAAA